jgi:HEAT repeat protein
MNDKIQVLLALVISFGCQPALSADGPAALNAPDPKVRLEAWKSLAGNGEEAARKADEIVPLLSQGLVDPDAEVRAYVVSLADVTALAERHLGKFPLSADAGTASALEKLLEDDREGTREGALMAIIYGFEPSKRDADVLLRRFDRETSPKCRAGIVDALLYTTGQLPDSGHHFKPSKAAITQIVKALNDPKEEVRAAAARAIGNLKAPPLEALPKLAENLDLSHPYVCQFVFSAFQRYGDAAKPYLPKLEEVRMQIADMKDSWGDVLRMNLDSAIRVISGEAKVDDQQNGAVEPAEK